MVMKDLSLRLSVIKKSVRGARTVHFILMGLAGMLVSGRWDTGGVLIPSILLCTSIAFVWLFTTMVNDAFDMEIDRKAHPERPLVRGEITLEEYRRLYITAGTLSLFFSLFLGFIPLLSIAAFMALAYLYSVPPARVRDRPYATIIIGSASSLSFLAGYSALFWPFSGAFFYIPEFSSEFITLFLIILMALSVSPLINAYHDIEADSEAGVRNLYTITGPKKGKALVTSLIPLLFSLPLILFHSLADLLVCLLSGFVAAFWFFRYGGSRTVFLLYFLVLSYFLLLLFFSS